MFKAHSGEAGSSSSMTLSKWWEPLFEASIAAFYEGDLEAGRLACEQLLSSHALPPEIERQTRRNQIFYTGNLPDLVPGIAIEPVEVPMPAGWSRFNPSITAADDGFRMILRSSNYSLSPGLDYTTDDPGGVFRTTNYLVALDPDLTVQGVEFLDDTSVRPEPPPFPVAGLEDCRLFHFGGAWHVSATVRDRDASGLCRMALARIEARAFQDF